MLVSQNTNKVVEKNFKKSINHAIKSKTYIKIKIKKGCANAKRGAGALTLNQQLTCAVENYDLWCKAPQNQIRQMRSIYFLT